MSIFQDKSKRYLYISILLLIVIIIYEQFSHGVTSNLMRLSILFPLIGGFILPLILRKILLPNKTEKLLWYMCISSFTVGFFVYGIFEIYGSVESLVYIYFYFGFTVGLISMISYIFRLIKKEVII